MKYISGAFSDIGNTRPNNEDSFFIGRCETDTPIYVGAVCDGIGGLQNGEVASAAITEHIGKWVGALSGGVTLEQAAMSFLDNIYAVNRIICGGCMINSIETGSTMSAVLICGESFMAANVGDSRIYLISDKAAQISEDDVCPAQNGKRGALRQCIGYGDKLFINTYYGKIAKNESILICSDGFYKKMDTVRMVKKCRSIRGYTNVERLIGKEIERLKKLGEKDNITACIIKSI